MEDSNYKLASLPHGHGRGGFARPLIFIQKQGGEVSGGLEIIQRRKNHLLLDDFGQKE